MVAVTPSDSFGVYGQDTRRSQTLSADGLIVFYLRKYNPGTYFILANVPGTKDFVPFLALQFVSAATHGHRPSALTAKQSSSTIREGRWVDPKIEPPFEGGFFERSRLYLLDGMRTLILSKKVKRGVSQNGLCHSANVVYARGCTDRRTLLSESQFLPVTRPVGSPVGSRDKRFRRDLE
jgi:hypothetical protein